jgi:hypothetical protein
MGSRMPMKRWYRHHSTNWRNAWLIAFNYRCWVSGESNSCGKLTVHHHPRLPIIIERTLLALGLPHKRFRDEYTSDEMRQIRLQFEKEIWSAIGIPLKMQIHKDMHKRCGTHPTLEQLVEYKRTNFKRNRSLVGEG